MEETLTLRIDSELLRRARSYAASRDTDLDEVIRHYLVIVTNPKDTEENLNKKMMHKILNGEIKLPEEFARLEGIVDAKKMEELAKTDERLAYILSK